MPARWSVFFAVEMRMFVLVLLVGCGKIGLFDVETGFDLTFGDVIAALVVEEIFVVVRLGFGVGLILDRLFAILGRNFLGRARGSFGLFFGFEFFIGDNGGAGLDRFKAFFFRVAASLALLFFEQRLTIGDRDLIIVGMDFVEGEEALAVAAILHESRLQRRLNPRHLGKIDVSLERPLGRGLEIKFLDLRTVENNHAGLFPVAGVYQHAFHGNLRAAHRGAPSGHAASDGAALFRDGWKAGASPPAAGPLGLARGLWRSWSYQFTLWLAARPFA